MSKHASWCIDIRPLNALNSAEGWDLKPRLIGKAREAGFWWPR